MTEQKKKYNRFQSFLIITFAYILTMAIAVRLAFLLPYNVFLNILIADIIATIIIYLFAVVYNNSSIYDPYWSVAPIVIVCVLAAVYAPLNAVSILLLIAVLVWGVRLSANWAYTFKTLDHQDWRYDLYKEKYPRIFQLVNFTGIFMMPTLIVYSAMLPAIAILIHNPSFNAFSLIGFVICLSAVAIQATADFQMQRFRKKSSGKVINEGLWRYSRHPNYLGEILFWWGVYVMVFSMGFSFWWTIIGAIANNILFLVVSIPLAENRYIKREGYKQYIKNTRMLLPIKKFNTKP